MYLFIQTFAEGNQNIILAYSFLISLIYFQNVLLLFSKCRINVDKTYMGPSLLYV